MGIIVCPISSNQCYIKLAKVLNNDVLFSPKQLSYLTSAFLADDGVRESTKLVVREALDEKGDFNRAAEILKRYKQSLFRKDAMKRKSAWNIKEATDYLQSMYNSENYVDPISLITIPGGTRVYRRRAAAVARTFMATVKELLKQISAGRNSSYNPIDIIKGIKTNRGTIGGVDYILSLTKDKIMQQYNDVKRQLYDEVNASDLAERKQEYQDSAKIIKDFMESDETSFLSNRASELSLNISSRFLRDTFLKALKLERILATFDLLSLYAIKDINNLAGTTIKFSNNNKTVDVLDESEMSLGIDNIEYDAEETVRGGNHEAKEKISPIATMTPLVREFASNIPLVSYSGDYHFDLVLGKYQPVGERFPITDDLGNQQYVDIEEVLNLLGMALYGILSVNDILPFLNNYIHALSIGSTNDKRKFMTLASAMNSILESPNQEELLGLLYQLYSKAIEYAEAMSTRNNTKIRLNRGFNYNSRRYFSNLTNKFKDIITNLFSTKTANGDFSNAEHIQEFLNLYSRTVGKSWKENNSGAKFYVGNRVWKNEDGSKMLVADQLIALMTILGKLGINPRTETVALLSTSTRTIRQYNQLMLLLDSVVEQMESYLNSGTAEGSKVVTSEAVNEYGSNIKRYTVNLEALDAMPAANKKSFLGLLNYTRGSEQQAVAKSALSRINGILEDADPKRMKVSYRYIDNKGHKTTYYSVIPASNSASFISTVKYFMAVGDAFAYAEWLYNELLTNPLLVLPTLDTTANDKISKPERRFKGRFYNKLVEQLYDAAFTNEGKVSTERFKSAISDSDSILNNLDIIKNQGLLDKKFSDVNEADHTLMMFIDYCRKESNSSNKYANIPIFILGDANAYKSMYGIEYGQKVTDIRESDKDKLLDKAFEKAATRMMDIYDAEVEKFDVVDNLMALGYDIENFARESGGIIRGKTFTDLNFLNGDMGELYAITNLRVSDNGPLISSNTSTIDLRSDYVRDLVKKVIEKYLRDKFDEQINKFLDLGLLKRDDTNKDLLLPATLSLGEMMKENIGLNKSSKMSTTDVKIAVLNWYLTHKLNLYDLVNLFDGNSAFYKNVKDFQKRNKQLHSSGAKLNLDAKDNGVRILSETDLSEKVLYFTDIKHDLSLYNSDLWNTLLNIKVKKYLEEGKSEEQARKLATTNDLKAYLKSTITDGQGFRTLKSYRRLLLMSGQWNAELEDAYQKITGMVNMAKGLNRLLTEDEKYEILNIAVSFKPIKPFLYGFETITVNGLNVKVPVLHKYAEAVLIPELLPEGSKLKDLAEFADLEIAGDDGVTRPRIDLLLSDTGVKVGAFKTVDISLKSGINDKVSLFNRLNSAYVHKIPYSAYRIQTNTSDHMYESTLFGTQARKMFLNGIKLNRNYSSYVNNEEIFLENGQVSKLENGDQLMKFYNLLICANIVESFLKFANMFTDKNLHKKITELLVNGMLANNRSTIDAIANFGITGDTKFLVPLFAPTISSDVLGLVFSVFKKLVNKLKIAGGAAIQVSPIGSVSYDDSGELKFRMDPNSKNPDGSYKNVLYGEAIVPFDLKFSLSNGQEYRLDYKTYCNLDGTLKYRPQDVLDENSAEYKSGLYQSYLTEDGKQYVPLIERHFPGILDLIAKRIPTERNYSMLRLRIKRFEPLALGATIKVPAEGTTIAGFDYDIDKLYLMRKLFLALKFTDKQISDIWEDFYNQNPDIKEALVSVFGSSSLSDLGVKLILALESDSESISSNPDFRIYKFWNKAHLGGTYQQAFNSFLSKNLSKYLFKNGTFLGESYDGHKTPSLNSAIARNNMLFQLFTSRLSDEETMESRFTPGGFFNASTSAKIMRLLYYGNSLDNENILKNVSDAEASLALIDKVSEDSWVDPEPNYDYSEPSTITYYNKLNQIAGKEIGVFANHNITHAYLSAFDEVKTLQPISFGSVLDRNESRSDLIHRNNEKLRDYSELMIAELLASSVDAVKDPVLNYLNINQYTANVAALLARMGFSMVDIGLLLNQPVIKEFTRRAENENVDVVTLELALELNDASSLVYDLNNGNYLSYKSFLSTKELAKRVGKDYQKDALAKIVLGLFNTLVKQAKELSDLTTTTKLSASNAVGAKLAFFKALELAISDIEKKFKMPEKSRYLKVSRDNMLQNGSLDLGLNILDPNYLRHISDSRAVLEQCFYDTNKGMLKLMAKIFPLAVGNSIYNRFVDLLKNQSYIDTVNDNVVDYAYTDVLTYLMSNRKDSYFNPKTEISSFSKDRNVNTYTTEEYFKNRFVKDYVDFRNRFNEGQWKRLTEAYPILDYLIASSSNFFLDAELDDVNEVNTSTNPGSLYIGNLGDTNKTDKLDIKDSWEALGQMNSRSKRDIRSMISLLFRDIPVKTLTTENKLFALETVANLNKLANYLVYYSFFKYGNTYSAASFLYDMPPGILQNLMASPDQTYIDMLRSIDADSRTLGIGNTEQANNIFKLFVRNHSDLYQFTRTLFLDARKSDNKTRIKNLAMHNGEFVDSFILDTEAEVNKDITSYFLKSESEDKIRIYPAIKLSYGYGNKTKTALFMAQVQETSDTNSSYILNKGVRITYKRVLELGYTDKSSQYYESNVDSNFTPFDDKKAEGSEVVDPDITIDDIAEFLVSGVKSGDILVNDEGLAPVIKTIIDNMLGIALADSETLLGKSPDQIKEWMSKAELLSTDDIDDMIVEGSFIKDIILYVTNNVGEAYSEGMELITEGFIEELKDNLKVKVREGIIQLIRTEMELHKPTVKDSEGNDTTLCNS